MLRLGLKLSALRPLTARATHSNVRSFSNFRPNVLQALQKHVQRQNLSLSSLKSARYSTVDPKVVAQYRRRIFRTCLIGVFAGGIGGFVGLTAGGIFFRDRGVNPEARAGVSSAEPSLLTSILDYWHPGVMAAVDFAAAMAMFSSGAALRMVLANPRVVFGASLVAHMGSTLGVTFASAAPENAMMEYFFWGVRLSSFPLFMLVLDTL